MRNESTEPFSETKEFASVVPRRVTRELRVVLSPTTPVSEDADKSNRGIAGAVVSMVIVRVTCRVLPAISVRDALSWRVPSANVEVACEKEPVVMPLNRTVVPTIIWSEVLGSVAKFTLGRVVREMPSLALRPESSLGSIPKTLLNGATVSRVNWSR